MQEQIQGNRKWYHKKRYLIPLGFLAILTIFGGAENSQHQIETIQPKSIVKQTQPATALESTTRPQVQSQIVTSVQKPSNTSLSTTNTLSNNNYYTNVDGNQVHSPAYSDSVPVGVSAQCRDGTYSFSQNRRGTCSGHGGVARWL